MEQIDGTLLTIIFSVLGFVVITLSGVIGYLFKSFGRDLRTIADNQSEMRIDLTTVKGEISNVRESLQRELTVLREDLHSTADRTVENAGRITDINKELGAISEWKKITSK